VVSHRSLNPLVFFTMPIQKQSFEDSLECPLSDQEILERQELDESEDYYNSALTDAQRNR